MESLNYKEIGFNISTQRRYAGYRQATFAQMLGITAQYLSQVENATRHPSAKLLVAIANMLDIDINPLFGKNITTKHRHADDINRLAELGAKVSHDRLQLFIAACEAMADCQDSTIFE